MDIQRTVTTTGHVTERGEMPVERTTVSVPNRVSWGAIWAGFFSIVGIEAVLTTLLIGIFASFIHPAPGGSPGSGLAIGIAVWFFLETIFAFYMGGRVTGSLSRPGDGGSSDAHVLAVWGFASVAILWALARTATVAVAATFTLIRMGIGLVESGAASLGTPSGSGAAIGTTVTGSAPAAALATWIPIYLFIVLGVSFVTARAGTDSIRRTVVTTG